MKLTKKLLPLAFVATTAAAIVPMTVSCSCSKDKGEIKVNDLQDFFEKGTYERQTEALASKEVTYSEDGKSAQATTAYFEALESNPKYLADDIWSFLASIDTTTNADPIPEFKLPFTITGSLGIATQYSKDNKTVDIKLNADVEITDIDVGTKEEYQFLKDLDLKAKGSIWLNGIKTGVSYAGKTEKSDIWALYLDYTNPTDGETLSDFWTNKSWEVGADLTINVGGYDDAGASGSFNIKLNSESDLVKLAIKEEVAQEIQTIFGFPFLKLGTLDNFKAKAA